MADRSGIGNNLDERADCGSVPTGELVAESPAVACSLSGEAMADRQAEMDALFRRALMTVEREGDTLRLRLRRGGEVAGRLERLVELERQCCPFLQMEVKQPVGHLEMVIAGPDGAEAVIDGFEELAVGSLTAKPR